MANTILRLGLWTVILVLAAYVLAEANREKPLGEMLNTPLLQQALVLGVALVLAGIVGKILGKGAKVVTKNRCVVCRAPIAAGAMYCRAHLRSILHDEEDKRHTLPPRR